MANWDNLPWTALHAVFTHLWLGDLQKTELVSKRWHAESQNTKRWMARQLANVAFTWTKANSNLMMSGSMARWLYDKQPGNWLPRDVDLFWCEPYTDQSPESSEQYVVTPSSYHGTPITFDTDGPMIVNILTRFGKIQLILGAFTSPGACFNSFDLSCVMLGYKTKHAPIYGANFTADTITAYMLSLPPKSTDSAGGSYYQSGTFVRLQRERTVQRIKTYKQRLQVKTVTAESTAIPSPFFDAYMHYHLDSDN